MSCENSVVFNIRERTLKILKLGFDCNMDPVHSMSGLFLKYYFNTFDENVVYCVSIQLIICYY